MTKNSKKDSSKSNVQSQYTSVEKTPEQISFEAEVQERIKQAKQQLKASSPFQSEKVVPTQSNQDVTTPTNIQLEELTIAKNRIQALESQIKHLETSEKVATVIQTEPTPIHDQHEELSKASLKIHELESQIDVLNSKLQVALSEINANNHIVDIKDKTEKPKPIYGMSAAVPSNEPISKDDLKMEFLNFTSAHIDQFNTRIKKTEELISNQSNQTITETKTQKTYPAWLIWLNMGLLGLVSMLLLVQFFTRNKNSEITTTSSSSNTSSAIEQLNNEVNNNNNKSATSLQEKEKVDINTTTQSTNSTSVKEETNTTTTPSQVASNTQPTASSSQPTNSVASKPNPIPAQVTVPVAKPLPSTVAKPISSTPKLTSPPNNAIAKTTFPTKTLPGSMTSSNVPLKQNIAPKPTNTTTQLKPAIQNKPIETTSKPSMAKPKQTTYVKASKPNTQNKSLPKTNPNNNQRDLEYLKEAIKPVDQSNTKPKTQANKTSPQHPSNIPSQPKSTLPKKTTSGEGVYFGED